MLQSMSSASNRPCAYHSLAPGWPLGDGLNVPDYSPPSKATLWNDSSFYIDEELTWASIPTNMDTVSASTASEVQGVVVGRYDCQLSASLHVDKLNLYRMQPQEVHFRCTSLSILVLSVWTTNWSPKSPKKKTWRHPSTRSSRRTFSLRSIRFRRIVPDSTISNANEALENDEWNSEIGSSRNSLFLVPHRAYNSVIAFAFSFRT
jgi:hypothetical protein